jgi:23S rRNA pseudouridine1911/1915/1917 synthase
MKPLEVLFEDNHIIAINKAAGSLVQGDKTGDTPVSEQVKDYLKTRYNKPGAVFLGTVHRLDRPVSGVLLFARTSKALERLNKLFKQRQIQKTYWAIVKDLPSLKKDVLVHHLIKNQKQNKSYCTNEQNPDALQAELAYQYLSSSKDYHLLEVYPKTGRHHQIRVQLSAIGSTIKGDLKYGAPRSNPDGSICLHARKIEFLHPVRKEPITIVANPPKDPLWDFFMDSIPH